MPQGDTGNAIFTNIVDLLKSFGEPLFNIGKTPISVVSVFTAILFIIIAIFISKFLRKILTRVYRRRNMAEGVQHSLNRILHYLIIAIGIYLAIDNLGISLTALAAIGGVLLVGIGFGLQELAKNFISGLILLLERPIRKGDYIEVGEKQGTVLDIGLRATIIRTYDDIEIQIPNGELINGVVVNRIYEQGYYRIRINVGVAHNTDPEQVRDILISVAKKHPDILETPQPIVFFEHFEQSYFDFRLMGWLDDAKLEPRVKSDLHFGVHKAFKEAGVDITFPQMDVHFRNKKEKTSYDNITTEDISPK